MTHHRRLGLTFSSSCHPEIAEIDPQRITGMCRQTIEQSIFKQFASLAGNSTHTFQMGLWLFSLFVVGVVAELTVRRVHSISMQHKLSSILLVMGAVFLGDRLYSRSPGHLNGSLI
jgi:hypothetical protein